MPATGSAKVSHHGTDWEHGLSTPRAQARHLKSWPCKHSDRHTPSRLPGHRDSGRGGPRPGCVALLKPRAWAAWPQPVLRPWWSQIHPGHSRGWRGDTNAIMVPQHSRLSWEPDLCRLWPWVRHSPSLSSLHKVSLWPCPTPFYFMETWLQALWCTKILWIIYEEFCSLFILNRVWLYSSLFSNDPLIGLLL